MLAGGRQIAALAFVGVVLALPNVGRPAVVEQFLWAYYGCLIMTSVGGLGFERAAGLAVARNGGNGRAALVPLLALRLATIPLEALGLWLVVRFVGVELPMPTFLVTVVWILGIQLQLPAFSVLRASGRRSVEPATWLVIRLVEAPLLLGLAAGGAGSFALVASVAAVECVGAGFAMWTVPGRWQWQSWRFTELELPWRTMSAFALIEVVGIAYLRADLLLVGRVLGPATGAAYGLLSRLIDGILGVQNSVGLWLFADAARRSETGDDVASSPIRTRSLVVFPRLAVTCSLIGIVVAPILGHLVPSLEPTIDTLRILLVVLPFFVLSAVETFTRSAAGRNRGIVAVLTAGLAVNVGLNLFLLSTIGLTGAGWALSGSECAQVVLLFGFSTTHERRLLRRVLPEVFGWGAALLLLVIGMNLGLAPLVGLAFVIFLAGGVTAAVRTRTSQAVA